MPVPRRRGGILCPCFLLLFVLCSLQALHCWQRISEIRFVPCGYWIEVCHIRVDPPIATVEFNLFLVGFVSVVLTCKLVHLYNHLFRASHLNHWLPESFVTDVSVVDVVVFLFTAFLCKLIRRKVIFTSRCFSIPVTVWSVLSDVEIRYGERVKHSWDVHSILGRIFCHKMSTCAVYNSCTAMLKTYLALPLRLHVDNLANFSVSCIHDCNLWLVPECIEWLLLFEVILNCFLLWMTYDSLNQIMNIKILRTFHRFVRNAGDVEINALIVRRKVELIRIITIFEMTIFLHFVQSFLSIRFPWSIVISDVLFFLFLGFPRSIGRTEFFLQLTNNLLGNGFPRSIFNGFRWLGWLGRTKMKCFSKWLLNEFPNWSMFNCRTLIFSFTPIERSCFKEIFGGGRGDKYCLSYNFSPFLNLSAFTNTICWKCSLKDNCVRSCLIEVQSFSDSKINIDPKYRILMSLPCILQVSCETWYRVVDILWIFVVFFSWINKQEEHRLSSAQILTSRYQSIAYIWRKIEIASHMVSVRKYSRSNQHIIL